MRLIFLLLFLYPILLQAQTSLQGKIADSAGEVIPYAQLILKSLPDSVIIKTEIADSAGTFKINITPNVQLLQVNATGYETAYRSVAANNSKSFNIALKLLSHELKTVSVTALKPLLERRPDRMIFNVSSSVSSIGSDVYELLKKAPGVRISENSGVSIAGKSTVSIMIDNKLQQVGNAELAAMLHSMSADNVDKIEVITTPPAKYDAQGNAGIINIVTKRSTKNGFNGSVGLTYIQRVYGSGRFSENLNYRSGKLNIYSSGNTNYLKFESEQKTTVPYGTQTQEQLFLQTNNPLYNRHQVGVDYNITSSSVIGLLFTIGTADRNTDQFYNTPVTSFGHLDSTLRTIADETERSRRKVVNLNYEWKIDTTGKKLNVDLDYLTRTENDSRDFTNQTFLQNNTPSFSVLYNRSAAKQKIDIRSAKADLVWPVKKIEFTIGAKVASIHINSDNRFYRKYLEDYIPDASRTNLFDYTENTQAAYFSASRKWEKWESQVGLRAENTQTRAISYMPSQTNTNNYLLFFPTAYLQYSLDEDNVFNINYSRRVERPSFEELNPFREYGSGSSYEAGNPFLQPSFYHNVELGYSLMSKYEFTVYAGVTNNMHTRVSKVDTANNVFYFLYENAGSAYNAGVRATAALSPLPWWEANIQAQAYYDKVTSDYYSEKASVNGIIAWEAQATNNFVLNRQKTLLAELSFEYQSRMLDEFMEQKSYYSLGMGIKALFFDKKLTLALTGFDVLRSELFHFKNIYNGVLEDNYFDSQAVNFTLNWKFGNNKIKAKRQHDSETDEIKRSK
jgi:hypothetical protein